MSLKDKQKVMLKTNLYYLNDNIDLRGLLTQEELDEHVCKYAKKNDIFTWHEDIEMFIGPDEQETSLDPSLYTEIIPSDYDKMFNKSMTRKGTFDCCNSQNVLTMDEDKVEAIKKLYYLQGIEEIDEKASASDRLFLENEWNTSKESNWGIHLLKRGNEYYLVDDQGYFYCRYLMQLICFEEAMKEAE